MIEIKFNGKIHCCGSLYDLDQLEREFERMIYEMRKQVPKKLSENHIVDEDQTVRWNRERVQEINKTRDEELKKISELAGEANQALRNALRDYIVQELSITSDELSDEAFNAIYSFVRGFDNDWRCYIDDIIGIISLVIEGIKHEN